MSSNYLLPAIFLLTLLSACGGGGGGGGGNNNTGNGDVLQPNQDPVADGVISTVLVPSGESVVLDVSGAVDQDGQIVDYRWDQLSGPAVSIEFTDGQNIFSAPETSSLLALQYRLVVTDNGGESDATNVDIYVIPAPEISAGADKTINGDSFASLDGTLINSDPDAPISWIQDYSWAQISGPAVTVEQPHQVDAGFQAPVIQTQATLEFQVTVTNILGVIDTDTVVITVIHPAAPRLNLAFPPPGGAFTGTDLDVYGVAWSGGCLQVVINPDGSFFCGMSDDIQSIAVDAGAGSVNATSNHSGGYWFWRAEDVPIPGGAADFIVTVTVTAVSGRNRILRSFLSKDAASVGTGELLGETLAVATNYVEDFDLETNEFDTIYVLSKAGGQIKLVPVDFATGNHGETVSDFSDPTLGPVLTDPGHMVFDTENSRFYISSKSPEATGIVGVDLETGVRSMVSGAGMGLGPALQKPHGLALGPDETIIVADNDEGAIFSIDPEDGARTVLADRNTSSMGIEKPLYVGWGTQEIDETLLVFGYALEPYILELDLTGAPVASTLLSQNSMPDSGPAMTIESQGLLALWPGEIFVLNGGSDNILKIEADGDRSLVASNVTGSNTSFTSALSNTKGISYSGSNHDRVLYVSGGDGSSPNHTLYAIDPVSGDKVVLSR